MINQNTIPVLESEASQEEQEIKKLATELIQKRADAKWHKSIIKELEKEAGTDDLDKLTKAKKDIADQIKEEKRRIEQDLFETEEYKEAKQKESESKLRAKELQGELKEKLTAYNPGEQLSFFDLEVDGTYYKLGSQKTVDLFVNGEGVKI